MWSKIKQYGTYILMFVGGLVAFFTQRRSIAKQAEERLYDAKKVSDTLEDVSGDLRKKDNKLTAEAEGLEEQLKQEKERLKKEQQQLLNMSPEEIEDYWNK